MVEASNGTGMPLLLTAGVVVIVFVHASLAFPLPPNHIQSAVRQIRHMRLLPPNSVVLESVPSVQVSSFKVDDHSGRGLNLQHLLGFDVPSDIIRKLETRVQTIRF